MTGQLQVRQILRSEFVAWAIDDYQAVRPVNLRAGPWVDVVSPGWLFGYILPGDTFVYEFRYEPETTNDER